MAEILRAGKIGKFRPRAMSLFKTARYAELLRDTADGPQASGLVVLAERRRDKTDTRPDFDKEFEPNHRVIVVDFTRPEGERLVWGGDIKTFSFDDAVREGVELFNRTRETADASTDAHPRELVVAGGGTRR